MKIDLKIFDHGVGLKLPEYATKGSAGMDLRAAIVDVVVLKAHERMVIPTGISMSVPDGYNAEVRPRSGLALKNGVTVLNAPGTIDSDYRGELKVLLYNSSDEDFVIERGMRIAQLVIQKYETVSFSIVDDLGDTSRSSGGYGSTGLS